MALVPLVIAGRSEGGDRASVANASEERDLSVGGKCTNTARTVVRGPTYHWPRSRWPVPFALSCAHGAVLRGPPLVRWWRLVQIFSNSIATPIIIESAPPSNRRHPSFGFSTGGAEGGIALYFCTSPRPPHSSRPIEPPTSLQYCCDPSRSTCEIQRLLPSCTVLLYSAHPLSAAVQSRYYCHR